MDSGRGAARIKRWMRWRSASMTRKVNWVLDADIRGFFDTLDHGWLVKFIEHRIADRRVVRLDPEMAERRRAGRGQADTQ